MPETLNADHVEEDFNLIANPFKKTILINEHDMSENPFLFFITTPLYAPLLFPNNSSDARDHCAAERTILSWVRLSTYLAVVAAAILVNFHLKSQPTAIERRISRPLGIIFWVLALASLATSFSNYIRTVAKYARRRAVVQHGVKTQFIFGLVATAIIAACGVFLGAEAQAARMRG